MEVLLPQRDWLTIGELENRWGISRGDVLHYLETGKLSAWIKLRRNVDLCYLPGYPDGNTAERVWTSTDRLYLALILNFKEIEWERLTSEYPEYCEYGPALFADLFESGIVLEIEGKAFCCKETSNIIQDDLLIMMEDVKKFEIKPAPKVALDVAARIERKKQLLDAPRALSPGVVYNNDEYLARLNDLKPANAYDPASQSTSKLKQPQEYPALSGDPIHQETPGGSNVSGPAPCVSSNSKPEPSGDPGSATTHDVSDQAAAFPDVLKLPGKQSYDQHHKQQAVKLIQQGMSRQDVAKSLREAGATLEQVGEILTDDGRERSRDAWEKRGKQLIELGTVRGNKRGQKKSEKVGKSRKTV